MYSDNFSGDRAGSVPAGWTSIGVHCSWTVEQEGTRKVVAHDQWSGYLQAGNAAWSSYALSVDIRPSGWGSEQDGIAFGIVDGGRYSLQIVGGTSLVLTKDHAGTTTTIASVPYAFSPYSWYTLTASMSGGSITASVNGVALIHAYDSTSTGGQIELVANDPVVFTNVIVKQVSPGSPPTITLPTPTPSLRP
jgi:hypothetical protein